MEDFGRSKLFRSITGYVCSSVDVDSSKFFLINVLDSVLQKPPSCLYEKK